MAQMYKMMLGTSGKQWEQLTVKDDGTMMLYFHGTNQSVTQEVTVITEGEWKGWLRSEKGSMWPGLESGKWNKMDDGRWKMDDGRCKMDDGRCKMDNGRCKMDDGRCNPEPFLRPDSSKRPKAERTVNPEPLTIDHQPSTISRQPSSTLKAIGMVAAATVALFVIYETGLLIPLGLIGLATGGLLK